MKNSLTRSLIKRRSYSSVSSIFQHPPFMLEKRFIRMELLQGKARRNKLLIFYVNMLGGQDELVFDGQSLAVDRNGDLIALGKQFEEDLIITDIDLRNGTAKKVEP
ncbi:MAG: nitrilase-related carbon-nitrogen hydrolase [Candidatus Bathyarchaeia archaeon]